MGRRSSEATIGRTHARFFFLVVTASVAALSGCSLLTGVLGGPPTAVISVTETSVGARVVLDGSGSTDPAGKTLTFAWTFLLLPQGSTLATIANATSAIAQFVPDVAGSYTVQLAVSDGQNQGTSSKTFTVAQGTLASEGTRTTPLVITGGTAHHGTVGAGDASYYTYWFTSTMGRYLDLKLEALSGNSDLYFYLRDSGFATSVASSVTPGTQSEYIWGYYVPVTSPDDGYLYLSVVNAETGQGETFDLTVVQRAQ